MHVVEWLKAALYGIVEGITEWLPVSSTGHLILLAERFPFAFSENAEFLAAFWELFGVVVQLGAILAVVVLYRGRLFPFGKGRSAAEKRGAVRLWGRVLLASVPAALAGTVGDRLLERLTGKDLNGWAYNGLTVALALIGYGVAFLAADRWRKNRPEKAARAEDVTPRTALGIGLFQVLSLIPGTSRSGSTILGGTLLGASRVAAAEFSFFMAVPVMCGASGVKAVGFARDLAAMRLSMPAEGWAVLAVGCATSFAVSLCAIRFLTDFVRRHGFGPFGIYRIALGAAVLGWYFWK